MSTPAKCPGWGRLAVHRTIAPPRAARRVAGWLVALATCIVAALAVPAAATAAIGEQNVLLIVNTASADSTGIRDAYLARYPSVRVWTYSGSTAATVDRSTYESEIRGPLDSYLRNTGDGQGNDLYEVVRVLVTTKGVPRRILDIDDTGTPHIGDSVSAMLDEYNNGRFDAACVDSELTLLHLNPQPGATYYPANYANNTIRNPYHAETGRIDSYSRAYVLRNKLLNWDSSAWGWGVGTGRTSTQIRPGDIYLVARLSGYTAADAIAAIGRAGRVLVDRTRQGAVIDRDGRSDVFDNDGPYSQGNDFAEARTVLETEGFNVTFDESSAFLTANDLAVLCYTSYGVNHSPSPPGGRFYVLNSLTFDLPPGAIFNTFESFNGRNFETLDPHDSQQAQVADWIHVGGTLGFGHVFEPLTFTVADNAILYERLFTRGWTFIEAAYAALPVLSWQNVVVGDPLTTFVYQSPITDWHVVSDHGPAGTFAATVDDGYVEPRTAGVRTVTVTFAEAIDPATVGAGAVTLSDQAPGDLDHLLGPLTLDPGGTVLTITLTSALPDQGDYELAVTEQVLSASAGLPFGGRTAWTFASLVGDVDGSGTVGPGDVVAARACGGVPADFASARADLDSSGTVRGAELLDIRSRNGNTLP